MAWPASPTHYSRQIQYDPPNIPLAADKRPRNHLLYCIGFAACTCIWKVPLSARVESRSLSSILTFAPTSFAHTWQTQQHANRLNCATRESQSLWQPHVRANNPSLQTQHQIEAN